MPWQAGEYIYFKMNQNKVLTDSEFDTKMDLRAFLDSVVNNNWEKHENALR
jgi:hypothetical protein